MTKGINQIDTVFIGFLAPCVYSVSGLIQSSRMVALFYSLQLVNLTGSAAPH